MFDDEGRFDKASFAQKVGEILKEQERLAVIINTPAHNPTGYALSSEDWVAVAEVLGNADDVGKVTLIADVAYIDFAGDEEESRGFLSYLDAMPENVFVVVAHSLSKSYTLYGMRCGALICMAQTREIADEFKSVCEFSGRGSWSNCTRAPQVILERIYSDDSLLEKVMTERKELRDMLLRRGEAFKQAAAKAGLEMVPSTEASLRCLAATRRQSAQLKRRVYLCSFVKA
ncbi:MAG: aminotransferase class I/II-fold pyridoxal phosphate-dependent enzyme [Anaerovoracaceae bacterium]